MASFTVRPNVAHYPGAPESDRDLVERVAASVESFEQGVGMEWRDRCNKRFEQYRGFQKFKNAWNKTNPAGRDEVLRDGKGTWGAQLHIPLSYRTIETMVPAAIAQRPRMLALPKSERFADNASHVQLLLDSQQEQVDIDLPFQAIMRSGRIYGLGVGMSRWRTEYARRRRAQEKTHAGRMVDRVFQRDYQLGPVESVCTFDDPDLEDVDPQDFMWDPYGHDVRSCEWLVHRTWPSTATVLDRISQGVWATESVKVLAADPDFERKLRGMGSGSKYDEVHAPRMLASGFSSFTSSGREPPHELLEWHDGDRVLSLLNRQLLVQDAENQCVGSKPFHVYRPTPLQKQMVGIGDLEPIEHLQRELDTLRSQRRDAATLALCPPLIFDNDVLDEDDLTWGPGVAIRATNTNGRVSDAIHQISMRDLPGSSYQEEQVIRGDFDVVSGINDALDPRGGGSAGTATEAQLVQASLSRRIELGSRRFEIEVVRSAARVWFHLDQRMILQNRARMLPEAGMSVAQAAQEGRWRQVKLGPAELMGDFEFTLEGGSMAARNIPQDRQDALQIMQLFGQHPNIDPRRPLERALKLYGIDDPDGWLKQAEQPVPQLALKLLEQAGVSPELLRFAVSQAQRQDPQLPPEQDGPDAAMVTQAMGGGD